MINPETVVPNYLQYLIISELFIILLAFVAIELISVTIKQSRRYIIIPSGIGLFISGIGIAHTYNQTMVFMTIPWLFIAQVLMCVSFLIFAALTLYALTRLKC